jgi:hypothetical protein
MTKPAFTRSLVCCPLINPGINPGIRVSAIALGPAINGHAVSVIEPPKADAGQPMTKSPDHSKALRIDPKHRARGLKRIGPALEGYRANSRGSEARNR